mmetsp:Transcript_6378/g.9716  ORF Transcript_6378/g.9716 Transcript_6378/m.9716 type:complete len:107 (-) Transcript_6378:110-430(-)
MKLCKNKRLAVFVSLKRVEILAWVRRFPVWCSIWQLVVESQQWAERNASCALLALIINYRSGENTFCLWKKEQQQRDVQILRILLTSWYSNAQEQETCRKERCKFR